MRPDSDTRERLFYLCCECWKQAKKSWMKYNLKKLIQPSQLSLYSQKKKKQNKITHKMYKFLLSISTTFSRELQFLWVFDESPRQFSQSRLGSNAQSTGARGQRRFFYFLHFAFCSRVLFSFFCAFYHSSVAIVLLLSLDVIISIVGREIYLLEGEV